MAGTRPTRPASRLSRVALLMGAALFAAVATVEMAASDDRPVSPTLPAPAGVRRVVGSASCSASACHGSIQPFDQSSSPIFRNEHTTWICDDPHSRAYQTLFSDRSKFMSQALAAEDASPIPAHEDPRCLACHTTPRPQDELVLAPRGPREDGVGCESCHGAASDWLGPHTSAGWNDLPSETRETSFGFSNTRDLTRRAEICAGCHVGSRGDASGVAVRDVNHDLIAAGHPRLTFEFSAYLANMPPHWAEKGENADPSMTTRAWAVGQRVVAAESVRLLGQRALAHDAPWPELSEYDCLACHRPLDSAASTSPSTGFPGWGTWPLSFVLEPPAWTGNPPLDPDSELSSLRAEMSRFSRDRAGIASRVERVLASPPWTQLGPGDPGVAIAGLLDFLADPVFDEGYRRWDFAAQRYLALLAHRDASPSTAPDDLRARLETIRDRLKRSASGDSEDDPGGDSP